MNLCLISYNYPYTTKGGEEFLQNEIISWSANASVNLTLMPLSKNSDSRLSTYGVPVDDSLARIRGRGFKLVFNGVLSLCNARLLRCLFKEIKAQRLWCHLPKLYIALRSWLLMGIYYRYFSNYLKHHSIDCMYTYWYTEVSNALTLLKERYDFKLITRAHGNDLYEERRAFHYFPFRAQLEARIDRVMVVGESNVPYVKKRLAANKERCIYSRLGVKKADDALAVVSPDNHFNLVSCSNIIPLKQVNKIIESIEALALGNEMLSIRWTHFGAGELMDDVQQQAKNRLSTLAGVQYDFKGQVSNAKVLEFYRKECVDVFIHLSSTEGLPLGVQEALSFGIPLVVLDVGCISEAFDGEKNGYLLPEKSSSRDIAKSLSNIHFFKQNRVRKRSYEVFRERFDADVNYQNFQQLIEELCKSN